MVSDRARKDKIRARMSVTSERFTVVTRALRGEAVGPTWKSHRRRVIAARCRVMGEPQALVTQLVGQDGSHGLDDCSEEQRRFRAQLTLFLLNAPTQGWDVLTGPVAAQGVWQAWSVLDRFLPYPETLVVLSSAPEVLRQVLVGPAHKPGLGMPGLRHIPTTPSSSPVFVHIPTGATLHVHGPTTPLSAAPFAAFDRTNHRFSALTSRERRLLDNLPPITVDAEQLLAGLLIRLPLADPDGTWALSNCHLPQNRNSLFITDSSKEACQFLWGRDFLWRFEWQGPTHASDIATALTDPLLGLAGTTAILPPRPPTMRSSMPFSLAGDSVMMVRFGAVLLALHGSL